MTRKGLLGLFIGTFSIIQMLAQPVPVIFDSDMGFDYDDVGALAVLHALEDQGEARVLATIASARHQNIAAVFDVINTYYGKPHLPVGVPSGDVVTLRDTQKWSDTLVANYPHQIRQNSQAHDAVKLYRSILAGEEDQSVTIVTVGFLTNIKNLLQSEPDEISPLTGKQLVKKKVKRLVSMAGAFPKGMEFNIEEDIASAQYAFKHIGVPVLFAGFEVGDKILTGLPLVENEAISNSPIQDVYRISIPQAASDLDGRMSWDQVTVLAAIRDLDTYFDLQPGSIEIADDGTNTWSTSDGNQTYLVAKTSLEPLQKEIDQLMVQQPVKKDQPLVVFVIGDHEYSSEVTMPIFAEELQEHYGMRVQVLTSYPDHNAEENIPGLEALEEADLAVFYLRWRRLPKEQIAPIEQYLQSGRPLIGLRTTTHAFNYPQGHELERWNAFGEFAFNSPPGWEQKGHTHYGHESTTKVRVIEEANNDPILTGVQAHFPAASWLYTVLPDYPLEGSTWLLMGEPVNPDDPAAIPQPVAWKGVNSYGGNFFITTLGHPEDFKEPSMVRLLINAIHWALEKEVPSELKNQLNIDVPYGTHLQRSKASINQALWIEELL